MIGELRVAARHSVFTMAVSGMKSNVLTASPMTLLQVEKMFGNFRRELLERINGLDWMEESDRAEAKAKALQTTLHAGAPDILDDQSELEDLYANHVSLW